MTTFSVHRLSIGKIFWIFFKLGLTSFGGPVAHLGYFHQEFVLKRGYISQQQYADLIALCQFLPGPSSSQVGMALGYRYGGYWGAVAAWIGFSLPSVVLLILAALGLSTLDQGLSVGLIHGLKIVAVAIVAQALWSMAKQLCPDSTRMSLMLLACSSVLLFPGLWSQVAVIVLAVILGVLLFYRKIATSSESIDAVPLMKPTAVTVQSMLCLTLFVALLLGLPLAQPFYTNTEFAIFDAFYRSGALVFGGGHVVLPLLQAEVVDGGYLAADHFFAGYALAQAMPGPLFSFAAFVGAAMPTEMPILMAMIAFSAIFLPSFLLLFAVLPFWQHLSQVRWIKAALMAVNAAVVGILLAALYQPMWTSTILTPIDFCLALLFWVALMFWQWPAWWVVFAGAVIGYLLL